jgi:DNA sulfur modification protein DndC
MDENVEHVRRLIRQFGRNVALVVNHSGGKDSTRMLGLVRGIFPHCTTYGVMADTGFEHQRPISAVDWARSRCEEFGVTLSVVRNPKRTYLEMVEQREMFPSAQFRQCTSDLKRGPIDKFIRALPEQVIINCIGIRAEESNPRSKLTSWKANEQLTTRRRTVYNWLPIFDLSLKDVLDWHRVRKVPLHPIYVPDYHWNGTRGGYLRRLSCRLCIFSSDADVLAIHQHDREAFDAVSSLEQKIGFSMRPGVTLVQIEANSQANKLARSQQHSFCFEA